MFGQDYVLRMIQQLANFVAEVAGLNRAGSHDEALAAADHGWDQLLDAPRGVLGAVDTPTLAAILREPDKMRAAAQLFCEEARALIGKGEPRQAAVRYRRAMELVLEARAADPGHHRAEDAEMLRALANLVPPAALDPRYHGRALA